MLKARGGERMYDIPTVLSEGLGDIREVLEDAMDNDNTAIRNCGRFAERGILHLEDLQTQQKRDIPQPRHRLWTRCSSGRHAGM